MAAYVIAQIDVEDPEGYQDYLAGFMPIFSRYGGKLLATSRSETGVIEGSWALPRTVLMEFPDIDHARGWLADPAYQELSRIRKRTARTNLVLVDGVSPTAAA